MFNSRRFALFSLSIVLLQTSCSTQRTIQHMLRKDAVHFADTSLAFAYKQYQYFTRQVPDEAFPRSLDKNGSLVTSNSEWWCSGFYPGTLILLQEDTKATVLQAEIKEKLNLLEKEKFNRSTHDLGFMMYCSFGNLNRVAPDSALKNILIQSAKSLSTRFSQVTKSIRSWDSQNKKEFIVIIDNMMNLDLLFYATRATGDSSFYNLAVTHANTTMANHFRPDNSSYHLVIYDSENGSILNKKTAQGANDSSAWARGQAWGLYGFTSAYRNTKDNKYLVMAEKIAAYLLEQPNRNADGIPYWDYNAPGIPNARRDASAGAIMASALMELATFCPENASKHVEEASLILTSLSGPAYRSAFGENHGFILKHGVGHLPANSEVDVPLSYADYYYVEGLMRYKRLALTGRIY
ncbi:MAG: glucuronyl hydrolase [Chitinophagaceae bacterium]|nr:MAG: glucuronyl hydrolase [Chitinophagaceae bacterium]